jgi:hypothetical protein
MQQGVEFDSTESCALRWAAQLTAPPFTWPTPFTRGARLSTPQPLTLFPGPGRQADTVGLQGCRRRQAYDAGFCVRPGRSSKGQGGPLAATACYRQATSQGRPSPPFLLRHAYQQLAQLWGVLQPQSRPAPHLPTPRPASRPPNLQRQWCSPLPSGRLLTAAALRQGAELLGPAAALAAAPAVPRSMRRRCPSGARHGARLAWWR